MIVLRLLTSADEAEQRLFLLHVDMKYTPSSLEVVVKLLVKMQRRLYLNKCTKLGVVVLDVEATLFVFLDECMLSANRNIMDSDIGFVASAKLDFVDIVKVYYVKLLLLFMVAFRRIYLERLDDHVVLFGLYDLKYLISLLSVPVRVLQLRLAKLAMECFPNIGRHMHTNLFVFITTEPLP